MLPRTANLRRTICQGCATPCELHQRGEIDHADPAVACPLGIWHALDGRAIVPSDSSVRQIPPRLYDGSAKWRALHVQALRDAITPEWLAAWQAGLPTCGCNCRRHFADDLAATPLPATGQFAWTVARHNTVNAHIEAVNPALKRPQMALADALKRWSNPPNC